LCVQTRDCRQNRLDALDVVDDLRSVADDRLGVADDVHDTVLDLPWRRDDMIAEGHVALAEFAGVLRDDVAEKRLVEPEEERNAPSVGGPAVLRYVCREPVGGTLESAFALGREQTEGPRIIGSLRGS